MKIYRSTSGSQAGRALPSASIEDGDTRRAIEDVKRCFARSIEPNFQNAIKHNAPIAAVMVALAAIDFLASYYCGKDAGSSGYEKFVDRYIRPLAPGESDGYDSKVLYRNLRSGLFHNYTTAKTPTRHFQESSDLVYVLIDDPQDAGKHLTLIEGVNNAVLFHIQAFFEHVAQAKDQYFEELERNTDLRDRFVQWYQESTHLSDIDISRLFRER